MSQLGPSVWWEALCAAPPAPPTYGLQECVLVAVGAPATGDYNLVGHALHLLVLTMRAFHICLRIVNVHSRANLDLPFRPGGREKHCPLVHSRRWCCDVQDLFFVSLNEK